MGLIVAMILFFSAVDARPAAADDGAIKAISPLENGYYGKRLDFEGIPIKASTSVVDGAVIGAYARLYLMLHLLPVDTARLKKAGAEMHLIGKNQVPSDLPENLSQKGKPYDGNQTIDERTRGTGGIFASCGEENILRLQEDRYYGRDICVHEFAHTLHMYGLPDAAKKEISAQYLKSKKLWGTAYAAQNEKEYFAELSMWYFGTHGDYGKISPAPKSGAHWLRVFDPQGYDLVDRIYSGAFEIKPVVPFQKFPPSRESSLRSFGGEKSKINFQNRSGRPVRIYWLDYEGYRKSYGTILPGAERGLLTFVTHPFVIADSSDTALMIVVAGSDPGTVVVTDSNFEVTASSDDQKKIAK